MVDFEQASLEDFHQDSSRDIFEKTARFWEYRLYLRERGYDMYGRLLVSPSQGRVLIEDPVTGQVREMVMMGSNNYLGLTTHPKVIAAGLDAYREYGAGAGSVPLLAGTHKLLRRLEERLAEFKSCEDACVFSTGYSSNVGIISGLARPGDIIFNDIYNHASIVDGCKLSKADAKSYPHNNMSSLESILERHRPNYRGAMIVTDGVFSMDGDIAPLPELIALAEKHQARLMIDEAHATGVIGEHGRGTPEHFHVEGKVDIVAGTLSKALGGVGGFVASKKEVVNYLRFYARSNMFSTALPPATAASLIAAIDVIENEPELRARLWENITYMRNSLTSLGFDLGNQATAIFPIITGNDAITKEFARMLHDDGIFANPVFYPAVSRKLSRVRLSVMATHTKEDLDKTIAACERAGRKLGVI